MAVTTTLAAQILSISTALIACGGIATLSLFDVPELQSQPASRSLPSTRWLFSRGSHIFPQAALVSSSGFAYLAYAALPKGLQLSQILGHAVKGGKVGGYLAAAILTLSIGPWTGMVMIPTNFALIKMNEEHGGARSSESARLGGAEVMKEGSAEASVKSKTEGGDELRELSLPQEKTRKESSEEDDRKVKELLGKFGQLNAVRAALMGMGGVVGLAAALAA